MCLTVRNLVHIQEFPHPASWSQIVAALFLKKIILNFIRPVTFYRHCMVKISKKNSSR